MKKNICKHIICTVLVIAVIASVVMLTGCSKEVTVPDVVGMTQEEAEAAITDLGLTMTVQRERYSDTTPEGSIDKMITEAGTTLQSGEEVKVVASLGEGRTVPNISVLTEREATNLVAKVGLNPIVVYEYSDEIEEGNIISYTDAGQIIPVGADVTITVSKGPQPQD